MASSERRQKSKQDLNSYYRGTARRKGQEMRPKEYNSFVLVMVPTGRKAPYRDKVLKILSRQPEGAATVAELFAMSKYSNPTQFKTSVLRRLQQLDFVYFDKVARKVKLTRLGWLVVSHSSLKVLVS